MTDKNTTKKERLSLATVKRLPTYLRYLKSMEGKCEYISSVTIAEAMNLSAIQVKKDIAAVSSVEGKPKLGFVLKDVVADIEKLLGYNKMKSAVLVGAGKLGTTYLSYTGFSKYGIEIAAAFDSNQYLWNTEINGIKVYPMDKLDGFVRENGISMGIITVHKDHAQEVCDKLVAAGIRGIVNFAPTHLIVPDGVELQNEDIAVMLVVLSYKLQNLMDNDNN